MSAREPSCPTQRRYRQAAITRAATMARAEPQVDNRPFTLKISKAAAGAASAHMMLSFIRYHGCCALVLEALNERRRAIQ